MAKRRSSKEHRPEDGREVEGPHPFDRPMSPDEQTTEEREREGRVQSMKDPKLHSALQALGYGVSFRSVERRLNEQPETVEKAILGRLERHEADELACRLSDLYPESFPSSSSHL